MNWTRAHLIVINFGVEAIDLLLSELSDSMPPGEAAVLKRGEEARYHLQRLYDEAWTTLRKEASGS
jgi:hypothetical protein